MTIVRPKLPKIPAGAEAYIAMLERDLTAVREELRALLAHEPTRIITDAHYGPDGNPRYVPDNHVIRFAMGVDAQRDFVDVRLEGASIYVNGSDVIQIEPRAGNCFFVRLREDPRR